MTALYKLSEQYNRIYEMGVDEEIDAQTVLDTMESLEGEIQEKLEACCRVIRSWESQSEGLKVEIATLTKRKRATENAIEKMKFYMAEQMGIIGVEKMEAGIFKLALQNSPPSMEIADESKVPSEYVEMTPVINKAKIKAELMAGKLLKFAQLFQGKHLRIR
jgi:hypothetical protein